MKHLNLLLLISLIFVSCKEESKTEATKGSYVIEGSAPGIFNGIRVYLKKPDGRGRFIEVDTSIVMNESFQFEGSVETPEMFTLHVNSVKGQLPVMIENADIKITIDSKDILKSTILGTESNQVMLDYTNGLNNLTQDRMRISNTYRNKLKENDTTGVKALADELNAINEKANNYPIEFIKENPSNYFSLTLLESTLSNKRMDAKLVVDAYEGLDPKVKNSSKGQSLKPLVDQRKIEAERIAAIEIGKVAPNFSAPTPEGTQLSLNDVKGKVTIIDFWAAWCGPCRRENPNLVRIYNKYHSKGLEIIGVSLDGNRNQKDPKTAWVEAIKNDKLDWSQVSNLQYFNDPVAQLYNINSIPATFILDSDGKIAAKRLRGDALEAKVAELLGE
ncbi:TlpA disulfide reductase family protein [Aegicerativicinus sediminis]|uniref:TlpA disulfide reductase family protein n=1 Tax=Aegicerativicinus sediminis TaxID=2893202 RepID=UPI001E61802D|nr:TlpA disulfide reductase family protein [Aegicerativicinus sediminis]